jgi:hypothetical protein
MDAAIRQNRGGDGRVDGGLSGNTFLKPVSKKIVSHLTSTENCDADN